MFHFQKKQIDIRSATIGDADDFFKVHQASFARPYTAHDFTRFLNDGCQSWTAICDGEAAGFILTQRSGDDAEILTLATLPALRHGGIAGQLVAAAIKNLAAQKFAALFLEVSVENKAALALYSQAGFLTVGRRPCYYYEADRPIDAFILKKEL